MVESTRPCDSCKQYKRLIPYRVAYGRIDRTLYLCKECAEPVKELLRNAKTIDRTGPLGVAESPEEARRRQEEALRRAGVHVPSR